MISEYLSAALGKARYEILPDDGSYYGEIPLIDLLGILVVTGNPESMFCKVEQ